jgi:hypothetical protein
MKLSSLKTTVALLLSMFCANAFTPSSGLVAAVNNDLLDAQTSIPSGWRKIDANGKFSFYLPQNMRETGVVSPENFHREYTNGRMQVRIDYDPHEHLSYSHRAQRFGKDFQEIELQVDGKKSFMFLYQYSDRNNRRTHNADLYIGDYPKGEVIVFMAVTSRSAQDLETAKTIFQTIKFPAS